MSDDRGRPIIVIKRVKRKAHGGHGGGSWKVAYADFVTAMMAFFLVMWLVGLDDETRRAIEQYFSHPIGYHSGSSSGDSPIATGPSPAAAGDARFRMIVRSSEERAFRDAATRLNTQLDSLSGALSKISVEVTVGDDGLRIELIESGAGDTYFPRGSALPRESASMALRLVAAELRGLQAGIVIEGHTDAVAYGADARYTNWELSADRANAARRLLEAEGIAATRIREVRGMAHTRLRTPAEPAAAENRRISLLLPFSLPSILPEPGELPDGMPEGRVLPVVGVAPISE
ncbi:MAG: flagellar motor protein MotB [Gemmatimonadaceae bacterium]